MAKRKASSDEEDQLSYDSAEHPEFVHKHNSNSGPKTRKRDSQAKAAAKAKLSDDQLTSDEDQAPPAKIAKKEPAQSRSKKEDASTSGDIAIHITPDGEKYIDLGKKKRATVRSFKGTALVDIREFYGADGVEKPGKKGISLTLEQWETLKIGLPVIDSLIESLQKK